MKLPIFAFILTALCSAAAVPEPPLIFPFPQKMEITQSRFVLDQEAVLLLPSSPSPCDRVLARVLTAELSDRHGTVVHTRPADRLAGRIVPIEGVKIDGYDGEFSSQWRRA